MIELVGLVATTRGSEATPGPPGGFDPAFVAEIARAYEAAGYDRVLVGQNARSADSLVIASWVAAATTRLKLMVAHHPGLLGRDLGEAARDVARAAAQADDAGADPCLWTGLTQATQGRLQVMCLVGSPATLVAALMRYYRAGIDNFLITGFDWLADTARIGAEIGGPLRELTALEPREVAA